MNAADVIGWIVEDTYYCTSCTPTNDENEHAHPIFGDSETDSFSHCSECDELIPENLTDHGWKDLLETAEHFLVAREGNVDVQRQWHEHVKGWTTGDSDDKVIELWGEALKEDNVKRAIRRLSLPYRNSLLAIKGMVEDRLKEDK
jgi:hypothetical protein